jgi:hypothetical protein
VRHDDRQSRPGVWAHLLPGSDSRRRGHQRLHVPHAALSWDWCELVQPEGFYANVPLGDIGDVCRQGNNIVMDTTVSDLIRMVQKIIPHLLRILDESGVDLPPNRLGILTGVWAGLVAAMLPGVMPNVGGETAAAVQAAKLALVFFAGPPPTKPHITYDSVEVQPGRTYLQVGVQHARHWSARKPVQM